MEQLGAAACQGERATLPVDAHVGQHRGMLVEGEEDERAEAEHQGGARAAGAMELLQVGSRRVGRHGAEAHEPPGEHGRTVLEQAETDREREAHRGREMREESLHLRQHLVVDGLVESAPARPDGGDGGAQDAIGAAGRHRGGLRERRRRRNGLLPRARGGYKRRIMATLADRLRGLLDTERPEPGAIAEVLDGGGHADRMDAITSLGGTARQGKLWTAAASAPTVTQADLVPPDTAPLREVIFHGKNSLPAFTLFQKRFCRPPADAPGDQLWGYNHQTLAWLTGPGYFVVHPEGDAPAAIDYRRVPPGHPASWPAVKPNDVGFSRFVYRDMVDYLRRVSRHVLIGRATRHGKELPNYFILCREP